MQTIGLIGGMSWESTQSYYALLNEGIKKSLGGLHSAKIILYSVDFAPIEQFQREGKWNEAGEVLANAAKAVENAGADMLLLCTNTMHKVASQITSHIHIPFIHIAEATAQALCKEGKKHSLLLGTKFTMKENFYKTILQAQGIKVSIPSSDSIEKINDIIFQELCLGTLNPSSKAYFLHLIEEIYSNDKTVDSIILGCTEIGLLLGNKGPLLPYFDTTVLHVNEAINRSLQ